MHDQLTTTTSTPRLAAAAAPVALALTAAALMPLAPARADIDVGDGVGNDYYIQTTGATALGAFTSAAGTRGPYLLGQGSLTIGDTVYTLPSGSVAQAIGAQISNSPAGFEPGPNADRVVYGYHSTGSVNGIRDLAIRNGLLAGTPPTVNDTQPLYVMGEIAANFPANLTNGYSRFVNSTPDNAPVPGVSGAFYDYTTDAKPVPQISYSDVRFEQAFSLEGQAMLRDRPTEAGYGKSQNPGAARSYFNDGATSFQRLADVGGLQGGVDAGDTLLRNDAVAVVPFTVSANPGTGLDSISEDDARFLQVAGRLQNGANFNSATRDIGSGTRNQGGNNLNVDPSWAAGERDRVATGTYSVTDVDGNVVDVRPGDEAKPGVNFATGTGSENPNEHRPSLVSRYADKDSGGGAQRPTILGQRMALGILSVGDVGSRARSNSTTSPLRVLGIDFQNTDYAGASDTNGDGRIDGSDVGAVQPTADNVTSGRYQLWSAAQAVTVRGTLATGATADGQLTGGSLDNDAATIYNDVDDDGSGRGIVRKFLDNITGDASLTNFAGGNVDVQNALTPLDALIAAGFIPLPLMEVEKDFDGDTQTVVGRSPTAQQVFTGPAGDQLRASLNFVRAGDLTGNVTGQSYDLFDVGNTSSARSPVPNVRIGFSDRTFLAGDVNGDGVRDLEDTEAWADALATTSAFLAANPSITTGPLGVVKNASAPGDLDIGGLTNQQLALVALTDLNGDGNVQAVGAPGTAGGVDRVTPVSREDVRYFLYGAAVDTSMFTTVQAKRELGVRMGQLRKNEAIARFNARIDAVGGSDSLKFEPFDTNFDDQFTLADARIVDRNSGLDYRDIDDVISTPDDLVAAELTDDSVIRFVEAAPGVSDVKRIVDAAVGRGLTFAGDANLDGRVNLTDFTALANGFGDAADRYADGDFNFNGTVNLADFTTLANNFGGSVPDGILPAPVPADGDDGVSLVVHVGTGEVTIVGDDLDPEELIGFEINSVAGSLLGDDFAGIAGLTTLAGRDDVIAAGTVGGFLEVGGEGLSLGSIFGRFAAQDLTFAYAALGGGSPVVGAIAYVPEPATAGVAAVGALGLLARRRRA